LEPEFFMADGESFSRAINAEYYRSGAGLKAGLEVAPIYRHYLPLFEGERFEESKRWGLEPVEQRNVLDFIAGGYLHFRTSSQAESFSAAEARLTVDWDEQPVPYRNVPGLISNEDDAVRRHELEKRYLTAMATLNPILEERERVMQREARGFNYPDYVGLYDDVRGLDLANLTETMQTFIDETNELYFSALDTYLGEMHILRDDARKCDLARIFRAPRFDTQFPSQKLLVTLHRTVRDLGMILEDQDNIRLDTEARPLKSPRAFCSPIDIPRDVRLVLKPSGGVQDYETLLHEAGHAEHFANIDPALPFAYRWLGDSSITESYAFLFEYLMHDFRWLDRHLGISQPLELFHLAGFHKLYFLRRYGSKLIYEQELHRADDPSDVAPLYDELLTRNLGAAYGTESYLTDVDDGFYCAQYLRAWIFEAQHRKFLQREFDEEWFRNEKAGRFLIDLWRDGQRHPVEKLAQFMGYEGLDIQPVRDEIHTLMGV
jgi:hypothetical protein